MEFVNRETKRMFQSFACSPFAVFQYMVVPNLLAASVSARVQQVNGEYIVTLTCEALKENCRRPH